MKSFLAAFFIAFACPAGANDVGLFYGKGVAHNPNSDYVQLRVYFQSGYFLALGNSNGIVYVADQGNDDELGNRRYQWKGGAQPFTSLGFGAEKVYTYEHLYAALSLAPTILNRTVDGNDAALVLEGRVEISVRVGNIYVGLARSEMTQPRVKDDPARAGLKAHDYDDAWPAPAFQGLFIKAIF